MADLSFIPLGLVLPALTACTTDDLVPMVKPQFEVGKDRLGKGGVVRDPQHRAETVRRWPRAARSLGLGDGRRGPQPAARPERQRRVLPVAAPRCGPSWTQDALIAVPTIEEKA